MKNKSEAIRLLCDGQEAFPEILSCIRNAKRSIEINMFIWRNDEIGKPIARELLPAADRGVSVEITKDRYGIVCEYCEEDQTSFFYPRPTLNEMLSIRTLEFLYNADLFGKEQYDQIEPLAVQMKEHPKIRIFCEEVRKDHSKHYIFDDEILIFGGIMSIQAAFDVRRFHGDRWTMHLLIGIAFVCAGIAAIRNPFGTASLLTRFVGLCFLILGIYTYIENKKVNELRRQFQGSSDIIDEEDIK